jgi:hypothetical protein
MALELQRADDKTIVEKVGFAGGLALSRRLLQRESDEYAWIPLSLNELARHDRATRASGPGLLQYDDYKPASDDLCLVGIPERPEQMGLKLWIVETKGGTSAIKKGREQVEGALSELQSIFDPESNYSDRDLLYSEFGKTVIDVAQRMHSYDVLTEEEIDIVSTASETLREGAFDISFVTDSNGHIGEVIRVRSGDLLTDLNLEHEVRSIEVPLKVMNLLENDDIGSILPDLNLSHVAFDFSTSEVVPEPETATIGSNGERADPTTETEESENGTPASETSRSTGMTDGESESGASGIPSGDSEGETESAHFRDSTPSDGTESETDVPEADPSRDEGTSDTDSSDIPLSDEAGESGTDEESWQTPGNSDGTTEQRSDIDTGSDVTEPHTDDGSPSRPSQNEEGADDVEPESRSADTESTRHTSTAPEDILGRMETSPEPDTSVDRSKLVSDLKREFESLGVDIHPPNPSTISIGPRKIGVNVHPKEGQTVEGIIRQLNSLSVHIQAGGQIVGQPIPSKGAVRLEIPHNDPTDVMLREGIEALADEFDSPVTIPLGVDTENEHHALSMLEEKHALVGGATGSGKSNFLSTIVSSLAILNDPSEVSISILDPKGVDFGRFESLPHVQNGTYLDTPEDCTEYLIDLLEEDLPKRKARLKESGFPSAAELNEYADEMGHEPMSYRVIVIDEYADLIMSLSKDKEEFEDAVTRLAQKGRALGYVLFLATQRPSADIVSGKIKANFPCRISFRLPSNTDSRVILDKPGAEDLQGAGDMIAITQNGQLNLQGYRLTPKDAIAVRDALSTASHSE